MLKENEIKTDCRDEIGVTVSLIDAIITQCRVLKSRDLTPDPVKEALTDLVSDEDLNYLVQQSSGLNAEETKPNSLLELVINYALDDANGCTIKQSSSSAISSDSMRGEINFGGASFYGTGLKED